MSDTETSTSVEMPRYKCHKEVHALKIKQIEYKYGCATITPAEEDYEPFSVDQSYIDKHNPQVGGYYVVYKDGYKSFSPAMAFEEGYARIDN